MNKKSSSVSKPEASSATPNRTAAEQWLAENAEVLRSSNEFIEAHGLPLLQHSCIPGVVALKLRRGR